MGDYLDPYYNSHDSFRIRELEQYIDTVYGNSKWAIQYPAIKWEGSEKDRKNRIPKPILPEIYDFLLSGINFQDYSNLEAFSVIALYLDVEADVLYESIGPVYKRKLIIELDEKSGVLRRKKIAKLF